MTFKKKTRTLKDYMTLTWVLSGFLAFLVCAFTFLITSWIGYIAAVDQLEDDLMAKSEVVARRLSAEVLLGEQGAAIEVAKGLASELKLDTVVLERNVTCHGKAELKNGCIQKFGSSFLLTKPLPYIEPTQYAQISATLPSFFSKDRVSIFAMAMIPLVAVLSFGILLQRRLLNRFLLGPLQSLVDRKSGILEPEGHWPKELKDLAQNLSASFEEREQAVYGQMARGVVHDIRTLLHSVLSSCYLVKELPKESEKRLSRLENLFRASDTNLSKIQTLIDLTLDGSREINVKKESSNILPVIQNAVKTNQALALSKKVTLEINNFIEPVSIPHDPIQLERVFTNLIKNALEACESQSNSGAIHQVRISRDESSKTCLKISIEDSGKGIEGEPERVFKLLRSSKIHGSGLGLTVSRKIVRAHGGDIIPQRSDNLGGARFDVFLPWHMSGAVP
jgi:signal transduction histidine kinase